MYWDTVEAYNDVTRKITRENGITLVDLARTMPKSSRYFYDFIHYTPQGAQAIGDILDDSLCPVLQSKFPGYVKRQCVSKK